MVRCTKVKAQRTYIIESSCRDSTDMALTIAVHGSKQADQSQPHAGLGGTEPKNSRWQKQTAARIAPSAPASLVPITSAGKKLRGRAIFRYQLASLPPQLEILAGRPSTCTSSPTIQLDLESLIRPIPCCSAGRDLGLLFMACWPRVLGKTRKHQAHPR